MTNTLLPIYARRVMFLTALVGLFASVYLLIVYTSGAPIICGESGGCDTVRASQWANVFGIIPRPLLGVLFYIGVLMLLIVRTALPQWFTRHLYWLTAIAATIGIVESVHLFYIQYALIEAFCDWCLVSAAATFVIFVALFGDRKTPLTVEQSIKEFQWQFIALTVAVLAGVVGLWWLL